MSSILTPDQTDKKKLYFNQYIPSSVSALNLSEDALKLCGYMTYRFWDDWDLKGWLPLGSDFLRMVSGGSYYKIINELVDNNVWELFVHESGASYSKDKQLCKCYRFCQPYRDEMYKKQVTKTRSSTHKVYFDKKPKKELTATLEKVTQDPILTKLLENYEELTLIDQWQKDLWSIDDIVECASNTRKAVNLLSDKTFAIQIGTGDISTSMATSGRLFHPAIMMRRELRPYLRFKGNKVVSIDVKAAHPNFLGKFASEEDRIRWIEECNSGSIYDMFVSDQTSRESVKKAFQQAISYCPKKHKLPTAIINYIKSQFPSIYNWLEAQWKNCEIYGKHLNTPQFILQSLEASIFIEQTFKPLADKFWMMPQHDGFLVEPENAQRLITHLKKIAQKELGFPLVITIK